MASPAEPTGSVLPSSENTALLPEGKVPELAPLARVLVPPPRPQPELPAAGTAVDAMRDEEIARTRLFIRMGWLLSVFAIGTVFVIDTPRAMATTFIAGLVIGMIVSFGFHRAFADPRNYTERRLAVLAVICIVNGHLAVLLYGAYSAAPLMIVIGIHFVARTEAERVARWVLASAVAAYGAIAAAITTGVIADPGAFASDPPVDRQALVVGALFVLGTFWVAYYTARQFRAASLAAIDELQHATRRASQRAALMDELLGDLERARSGPGRHTDQVVGAYRLGAVLGRGAMGEVYEAHRVDTGDPAAVKLLRPGLAGDPAQRARLAREIDVGAAVASPHVVRVLGGFAGAPDDAHLPHVAMERLRGLTLAEQLRREPRLSADALRALCRQVGAAIDAAAAAGVVHRDLKPQNLFRCDDGTWKVLDFGVALLAGDAASDAQGVVGTPHYMAPEQAQGRRADPRADLHALGAIAYRCATGRHPFDAADTAALLYRIVHGMPLRPGALAELPIDVDRFIAIALAKSPDDRFASGAALARAVDAALDGSLDRALRDRADAMIRSRPWEAP
jgi:protein kinase-like protein